MAANFKKGLIVRQKMPAPFEGVVVDMRVVEDELGYLVRNGEDERWFRESDLEAAQKSTS